MQNHDFEVSNFDFGENFSNRNLKFWQSSCPNFVSNFSILHQISMLQGQYTDFLSKIASRRETEILSKFLFNKTERKRNSCEDVDGGLD